MKVKCPICKVEVEKSSEHIQKCSNCSFYFDLDQIHIEEEVLKVAKIEVDESVMQSVDIAAKDLAQKFDFETLNGAISNKLIREQVYEYLRSKYQNFLNLINHYVLDAAVYYSKKKWEPTVVSIKMRKFTFCFTGKIKGFTRKDLESIVTSNGHRFSGTVTYSVDYLVTDFPNSSTNKIMSARAKGISVISSNEFFKLLREKK